MMIFSWEITFFPQKNHKKKHAYKSLWGHYDSAINLLHNFDQVI